MRGEPQRVGNPPAFLFIAGDPALDFVNTRPVLRGRLTELLPDFAAALRWFVAANLLDPKSAGRLRSRWAKTPRARAFCRQLLTFREQLRRAILSLESGKPISPNLIHVINRMLAQHPLPAQLLLSNGTLQMTHRFAPQKPADLFAPLANAAAAFFARLDPMRLRQCENCVLHFRDTTKNATRRWCSMKLCGNRAKVAKYAARHHLEHAEHA